MRASINVQLLYYLNTDQVSKGTMMDGPITTRSTESQGQGHYFNVKDHRIDISNLCTSTCHG